MATGTLKEPGVTLFNAEFQALADSGDYEGPTPRVIWQAPMSGVIYIDVYGWDLGTYSLTVKATAIMPMLKTTTPTPGAGPPS